MSATAGMDFGNLQSMLDNLMGQNSVVGQTTPQWTFPKGQDKVPDSVRNWFLRSDNGASGLNEFLQNAPPEDIDKFRAAVNSGLIVPGNQAAQDIASSYGGLRAGDRTPLGPTINGMPSGMNPDYWAQYNNLVQTGVNYQLGMLDQMGYFNGMPTLERQQVENQIAQQWVDRATNQFNSLETQRNNMAQNGLTQQQIDNQNIQKMSELFGGQMVTDANGNQTFQPTEQARQFDTTASGWLNGQRTLAGQAQDWAQQKDVAQAAANPRDYIYAQMLGNARGGLAGQPATNQLQMPQQGMQPNQQPAQFGEQYQQLQNLSTMQGLPQQGVMNGQAGDAAPVPTPQAAAQGATPGSGQQQSLDLSNPDTWQSMLQAGNQDWRQALQGMSGISKDANWHQMTPGGSEPTFQNLDPTQVAQQVQANQRYAGVPGQFYGGANPGQAGNLEQMPQVVDDTNWTPEQRAQWTQQQQANAQDNVQRRMQAMAALQQPGRAMEYAGGSPGTTPTNAAQQKMQALSAQGGYAPPTTQQGQMPQGTAQGNTQSVNGNTPFTTSAFSQALMKNRVVPQSGAMGTQGAWTTPQALQSGPNAFNPNKIRTQDYLRGKPSEQAGFQAVGSQAGFSEDDLTSTMKGGLPKFNAPGSGKMI